MDLQPSFEQQKIINLLDNNNVIVDSVAGCGKTTTNLFIAKHYSNLNILLLTYNSKLKIETKERVKLHNINNLDVFTYHSFTVKYYNSKGYTDKIIKDTITDNLKPKYKYNYDLIIIDEAQDLTPLYYELICKIYKDNKQKIKICLLGDVHQSIYKFNNADGRYLVFSDKLFNLNDYEWKKANLSYSFRITKEMADFVNNCVFNYNKLLSNKISNVKPKYYICNSYDDECILKDILNFINMGYKYDDIFILAPSVKSVNSPIRNLENKIKNSYPYINVYVPTSDEEEIDKTIIDNKIVFSTFHQTKGLERKIVIVFSFDYSYVKYFSKNKIPIICPNEIYVAITRAKEHLILVHDYKYDFLPFIDKNKLHSHVNFGKIYYLNNKSDNNKVTKSFDTKATDLVNHLPYEQILKCLDYFQIDQIRQKNKIINISTKIEEEHGFESVSEITGTAIPLYYEFLLKGNVILKNNDFSETINSKDDLLRITNNWCSHKSGYIFKNTQITNYDWLSDDTLETCINRLKTLNISKDAKFEQKLKFNLLNRDITGYYDCMDNNNFYEFKCVKEIKNEHYIQLTIYAYLYEINRINMINELEKEFINYINTFKVFDINNIKINNIIGYEKEFINYINKLKVFDINNIKINDIIGYEKDNNIKEDTVIKINKLTVKINNDINIQKNKIKYIMNNKDNLKINDIEQKLNNIKLKINELKIQKNYYLYNILSDELFQINFTFDNLEKMVCYLINYKYYNDYDMSDEIFLKNNLIILQKYLPL
jgi:hypothetical protein